MPPGKPLNVSYTRRLKKKCRRILMKTSFLSISSVSRHKHKIPRRILRVHKIHFTVENRLLGHFCQKSLINIELWNQLYVLSCAGKTQGHSPLYSEPFLWGSLTYRNLLEDMRVQSDKLKDASFYFAYNSDHFPENVLYNFQSLKVTKKAKSPWNSLSHYICGQKIRSQLNSRLLL